MTREIIKYGFKLEEPDILIPWHILEKDFLKLIGDKVSIENSQNIIVFTGLVFQEKIKMHIHFYIEKGLKKVRLFRHEDFYKDKDYEAAGVESFKEMQPILKRCFGIPNIFGYLDIVMNYKNVRHFKWHVGGVKIEHSYDDSVRGFEEKLEFTVR